MYIPLRPYLSLFLFIPVNNDTDRAFYDDMITNVNEEQVDVEDRLSSHSYYYDSAAGEIRMCVTSYA